MMGRRGGEREGLKAAVSNEGTGLNSDTGPPLPADFVASWGEIEEGGGVGGREATNHHHEGERAFISQSRGCS
jgi:hypothetical protein